MMPRKESMYPHLAKDKVSQHWLRNFAGSDLITYETVTRGLMNYVSFLRLIRGGYRVGLWMI